MIELHEAIKENEGKPGHILEFGVASGRTFLIIMKAIRDNPITVVGYDSFQGLPEEAPGIWCHSDHSKGGFCYPQTSVCMKLIEAGFGIDKRVVFVPGFYEETLKREDALKIRDEITNLIYVNLDTDLYISTIQVLEYIKPVLRIGTRIYFDDWKPPQHHGPAEGWAQHRAWAEFAAANPQIDGDWVMGVNSSRIIRITRV